MPDDPSSSAGVATSPEATILLVEDDPDIARTMRNALGDHGYQVVVAQTGAEARELLGEVQCDLIVMDLVLPDADGLLLTAAFRELTRAPILICSARDRQVDRVLGLKLGATDFVGKPFDLDELEARIEAILRRTNRARQDQAAANAEIRVGDIVIAPRRATVTVIDQQLHLTPTEYRLLTTLASRPDAVFDRRSLSQRVWGYSDPSCDHLVDVHVGRLRAKLRSVRTSRPYLVTVRKRGFRLLGEVEEGEPALMCS